MAIHEVKKQTDIERRLKLLRQQIYGKTEKKWEDRSVAPVVSVVEPVEEPHPTSSSRSDILYLHQDLLKIFLLATSAIGLQLILFFLSRNHILNLNFF